jgi:hypothetical protein
MSSGSLWRLEKKVVLSRRMFHIEETAGSGSDVANTRPTPHHRQQSRVYQYFIHDGEHSHVATTVESDSRIIRLYIQERPCELDGAKLEIYE